MSKSANGHILIIDDDEDITGVLKTFLEKQNYIVQAYGIGEEAIRWMRNNEVDLIICDFELKHYSGLEILQKAKILEPKVEVIIVAEYANIRNAINSLKKGAFDYVTKPLYPDEILSTVQKALDQRNEKHPTSHEKGLDKEEKRSPKEYIIGPSYQSQLVEKHIDLIAPTDMSVIICGETGTGKEYVARSIHQRSNRTKMPFVAVDCGALSHELAGSELFGHVKGSFTGAVSDRKGCFERANGGTLFLDEIGNLSYENQVQLLRVLQEQVVTPVGGSKEIPVDVRVLVASNEDLKSMVNEGRFREDIFHRLNEFKIELTSLRERPEDVEVFAQHFLKKANKKLNRQVEGFDEEVLAKFKAYEWPGNLRELKNIVKRAVLICQEKEIDKSSLPVEISELNADTEFCGSLLVNSDTPISLKEITEKAERGAIQQVLKQTDYNKTKTAEILQVDRKTLYNKMRALDIEDEE